MNNLVPVLQTEDGATYPLISEGVTTLGAGNAMILLSGEGVVPLHAAVIRSGSRVLLRADAGEVILNGAPLAGITPLSPYDTIQLGQVTLRYRLDARQPGTDHPSPVSPRRPPTVPDEENVFALADDPLSIEEPLPEHHPPVFAPPPRTAPPVPPSATPALIEGMAEDVEGEEGVKSLPIVVPSPPSQPFYMPSTPPIEHQEPLPILYKPPAFYLQDIRYLKVGTIAIFALDETDLAESLTRKIAGLSDQPCPLVFSRMGAEVPAMPKTTAKKLAKTDLRLFAQLSHRERRGIELVFTICYVEATAPDGRDAFAFVNLRGDRIDAFIARGRQNPEPFNVVEYSTLVTAGYGKATLEHMKYMRENYIFGTEVTNVRIFPPLSEVT